MTDRSNPISLAQIHSYLWGAATILRGLIGAGDYKQFIFPLVFYKRLSDIWDEDYTNALATYAGNADLAKAEADERFVIPAGAHWNDTRTVAKDVGKALQDAMRTIEAANPGSFGGIFGDALEAPRFTEADRLRIFDVVLANPPYSIKRWNRDAWSSDPWGHNALGTPPQGRADFAFFQHILASLDPHTGRCAIRFPHGVLFRNEEAEMRRKLIESDRLDCVLGLGPNLFFNSPMEACVVVCRARKPPERQGRILFIDAINAITRERAYSFLKPVHQQRIAAAYDAFGDEPGFAKVATLDDIAANGHSLSIPLYGKRSTTNGAPADTRTLAEVWADWEQDGHAFWQQMDTLVETLDRLTTEGDADA